MTDPSIIYKGRADARVAPAAPLPPDRARGDVASRRRPLGLRPIVDDDEAAETSREPLPAAQPQRDPADNRAAFMSDIDMIGFVAGQVIGEEVVGLEKDLGRKLA